MTVADARPHGPRPHSPSQTGLDRMLCPTWQDTDALCVGRPSSRVQCMSTRLRLVARARIRVTPSRDSLAIEDCITCLSRQPLLCARRLPSVASIRSNLMLDMTMLHEQQTLLVVCATSCDGLTTQVCAAVDSTCSVHCTIRCSMCRGLQPSARAQPGCELQLPSHASADRHGRQARQWHSSASILGTGAAAAALLLLQTGCAAAAANVTSVATGAALKRAIDGGAAHVHITAHLDLTSLPLLPAPVPQASCSSCLQNDTALFWLDARLESLTVWPCARLLLAVAALTDASKFTEKYSQACRIYRQHCRPDSRMSLACNLRAILTCSRRLHTQYTVLYITCRAGLAKEATASPAVHVLVARGGDACHF